MPQAFNQNGHPLGQREHLNQIGPSKRPHFFEMIYLSYFAMICI
jgi:hypothetical protein